MRQKPIRFDCVEKTLWSLSLPTLEGAILRLLIERVIDLYRAELLAVVLEPAVCRQFRRIEDFLPMPVIPAGSPDAYLSCDGSAPR